MNKESISCYLHAISREIMRNNEEYAKRFSLNASSMRLIGFLHFNEKTGNRISQKDVEKRFNIRASSVTSMIKQLEEKGFVVRVSDEGDARIKYVTLTDEGRNLSEQCRKYCEEDDARTEECLNEEERKLMLGYLQKILERLRRKE